jgi:hypothetical protein
MQIIFSHSDSYCVKVRATDSSDRYWLIIGSSMGVSHANGAGLLGINGAYLAGYQLEELLKQTVPAAVWSKTEQVVLAVTNSASPVPQPLPAPRVGQPTPNHPPPAYTTHISSPLPTYAQAQAAARRHGPPPTYAETHGFTDPTTTLDRSIAHDLSVALGRNRFVRGFRGEVRARDAWAIYASIHYNEPSKTHSFLSKFLPIKAHHGGRVNVKTVDSASLGQLETVIYRAGRGVNIGLRGPNGTKIPLSVPNNVRNMFVR